MDDVVRQLHEDVSRELEGSVKVGDWAPEDVTRLRRHERQELVDLLAQGGMPRLFWPGVERWINKCLESRVFAVVHSRR